MSSGRSNDEIDLVELVAKIFLKVQRNSKSILVAFIIGTILGAIYYQLSPKKYRSRALISSEILTESYSKSLVDDLNRLRMEGNLSSLATKLNLTEDQVSNIAEIKIKNTIEKSEGLKEPDKSYLTIEVESYSNSIWPALETSLTNYFENNEFVKIRVDQKKKYIREIIKKIDEELEDLQDLKSKIVNGRVLPSGKENLVIFDPTTVNSKILELNKEKINLQNSLETVNSIQIVEGFTVFEKPFSPKLSISLGAGASFGLILMGIIVLYKSLRKITTLAKEKLGQN